MGKEICRAFTFIKYHIPLTKELGKIPTYVTIGFFDGLITQELDVDYEKNNLNKLWDYIRIKTKECEGRFSYQNIFGISNDGWNSMSDREFWNKQTDYKYPLVFVVFLQIEEYISKNNTFEEQCKIFNEILREQLEVYGVYYTYGSIDKNDFIVCIKSRNHNKVVDAIKKIQQGGVHVVYSYSILSIHEEVLSRLNPIDYKYLYEELIDSICFKGISNSYKIKDITLDQKYYELCRKLSDCLYDEKPSDETLQTYDILGDNDFRFIARKVSLGKLLKQFSSDGVLNYFGKELRYYLYSSSLVLNTVTKCEACEVLGDKNILNEMDNRAQSKKCNALMDRIDKLFDFSKNKKYKERDSKLLTIEQSIRQLLQSLKVLERSTAKKYDFYTLYSPLSMLVDLLEESNVLDKICEDEDIYEFLHKISMTLNGAQRTDIQFFQIQDFNSIIHYSPAKLRAFYAIWAFMLADFYNQLNNRQNEYSFILAPGVFKQISVRRILGTHDNKRLMLVTVPENKIYSLSRMCLILAHETSHFVGTFARKRENRLYTWISCSARILELEFLYTLYNDIANNKEIIEKSNIYTEIGKEVIDLAKEKITEKEREGFLFRYYSTESVGLINDIYQKEEFINIRYYFADVLKKRKKEILGYKKLEKDEMIQKKVNEIVKINHDFINLDKKLEKVYNVYCSGKSETVLLQLKYITNEMFADIMSILTLEITPERYIASFCAEGAGFLDPQERKNGILQVRIGIVVITIVRLVNNWDLKSASWLEIFTKNWKDGITGVMIDSFPKGSNERLLAAKVFGYIQERKDFSEHIKKYISLIDSDVSSMCYFNDDAIVKELSNYLYMCARYFVAAIGVSVLDDFGKNNIVSKEVFSAIDDEKARNCSLKKKLVNKYNKLCGKSIVAIMQEIETSLAQYDSNSNKHTYETVFDDSG